MSVGHNRPDMAAALREDHSALLDQCKHVVDCAKGLLGVIGDDQDANKAADVIKDIAGCRKNVEAQRKAEKEPYRVAGKAVDGFFVPVRDSLDKAKTSLTRNLTLYERAKEEEERRIRLEEARAAQEEADKAARQAEEAAAKVETVMELDTAIAVESKSCVAQHEATSAQRLAGVKAADLSRTRSDRGTVASLRTDWDFEVEGDIRNVPLDAIAAYISVIALEQAIRGFVRAGGRKLPGVRIYEKTTAVVR